MPISPAMKNRVAEAIAPGTEAPRTVKASSSASLDIEQPCSLPSLVLKDLKEAHGNARASEESIGLVSGKVEKFVFSYDGIEGAGLLENPTLIEIACQRLPTLSLVSSHPGIG